MLSKYGERGWGDALKKRGWLKLDLFFFFHDGERDGPCTQAQSDALMDIYLNWDGVLQRDVDHSPKRHRDDPDYEKKRWLENISIALDEPVDFGDDVGELREPGIADAQRWE